MGRELAVLIGGVLALLILMPLLAALVKSAADAAIGAIPAILILYFIIGVIRGMTRGPFH
jgi:hypothetical protein